MSLCPECQNAYRTIEQLRRFVIDKDTRIAELEVALAERDELLAYIDRIAPITVEISRSRHLRPRRGRERA